MAPDARADLKERVLRALSTVTDPELDEPITELGFVKDLSVSDDGRVSLDLVTSTFWCSPNFVYMMLEETREVVSKLSGIKAVCVHLEGHHDADLINRGINSGKSFSECYESEAKGDLVELNRMIRTRALRSRLFSMAAAMARAGIASGELLRLSRQEVTSEGDTFVVRSQDTTRRVSEPSDVRRVARYLDFLAKLGRDDGPLVIWDLEGTHPEEAEFAANLALSRTTKSNFSLNAELCRALLSARLGADHPS